ncbi:MAG: tyrosine-type recombinase/integrase [Gammaproteobacteria bacterium]|jgi:integrase|nr:tyrosine-type recombinase/integrase [Gammaproteobacteria bacterium]
MPEFNPRFIAGLSPREKPYRVFEDAADKGFCLQVNPSGKKVFYLSYSFGAKRRMLNLGSYHPKHFSVKKARDACRAARVLIDNKVDPLQERINRESAQVKQENTLLDARREPTVDEVLTRYTSELTERTAKDVELLLSNPRCDVRGQIGGLKIREVTVEQLTALWGAHIEAGNMRQAGELFSYLKSAFIQAKEHLPYGLIDWRNPFADIRRPRNTNEKQGGRTLDKPEIRIFLDTLDSYPRMSSHIKTAIKIMIFTGQRTEQVSRMQWDHLDLEGGTWDIPVSETKVDKATRVAHVIPLTATVRGLIEGLERLDSPFLFPGRADGKPLGIGVYSKNLRRMLSDTGVVASFTPRDLRRTVATHLSSLGVQSELIECLLDHSIPGVTARHDNRHTFLDEKRAALETWERELWRIRREQHEDTSEQCRRLIHG